MRQGDIYLVRLPPADGREQAGTRPAIIVQDPIAGRAHPQPVGRPGFEGR